MDYKILTATSVDELAGIVNEHISIGWEPAGGVSVSAYFASWENQRKGYTENEDRTVYAQAMTNAKRMPGSDARARHT